MLEKKELWEVTKNFEEALSLGNLIKYLVYQNCLWVAVYRDVSNENTYSILKGWAKPFTSVPHFPAD